MRKYTRGEFLGLSAMLAGVASVKKVPLAERLLGVRRSIADVPDFIIVNARVLTQDAALPRAEAFAVKDGKFMAVGTNSDVRNLASRNTPIVDAAGATVLPGFIDCHCHPSGVTELYDVDANLRSVAAIQQALRKKAATTPPGFWIDAYMFDDTKLTDGPLTRAALDQVSTQHPIGVHHRGGHTSWYNTKAFDLAGVTRDTPDPRGGRYFRENGELNGHVAELATDVIERVGKREAFTAEQERERARLGMQHISKLLSATGLTSVHDASTSSQSIRAYEDARAAGELRHRAYLMVWGGGEGNAYAKLRDAGVYTGFGDEWIRIGGMKRAADGSASERTMRMSTPYVGTNDYGILTMSQQEID